MTKINYYTDLPPATGPGRARMLRCLGPERAEALRQQVLREQQAALERVHTEPVPHRDRRTYRNYPR
jgi:hypothetical protein